MNPTVNHVTRNAANVTISFLATRIFHSLENLDVQGHASLDGTVKVRIPTQVWYKAYPGLTAVGLERSIWIRRDLESSSLSDQEAREWVALL